LAKTRRRVFEIGFIISAECNGGRWPVGGRARDGRLWFPTTWSWQTRNPEREQWPSAAALFFLEPGIARQASPDRASENSPHPAKSKLILRRRLPIITAERQRFHLTK